MTNGWTGRIYPNGEFSATRLRRTNDVGKVKCRRTEEQEWQSRCISVHGLRAYLHHRDGNEDSYLSVVNEKRTQLASPLGLSNRTNSHKAARGLKGITSYGRRMVRNGAYLLEKDYGRKRLSFLTLTIPNLLPDEWLSVCQSWAEIVRVFLQWLQRRLVAAKLPSKVLSVTEIQENREPVNGCPPLHLHMLFVGRHRYSTWLLTPVQIRSQWLSLLTKYAKSLATSSQHGAVERLEMPKGTLEHYLAKYMSKGIRTLTRFTAEHGAAVLPATWWNCSSSMRNQVKKSIGIIPSHVCYWMMHLIRENDRSVILYGKVIQVTTRMGYELMVGLTGKLNPGCLSTIRAYIARENASVGGLWKVGC